MEEKCSAPCRMQADGLCKVKIMLYERALKTIYCPNRLEYCCWWWNTGMLDSPVESFALGTMTYGSFKVQILKYTCGNGGLHNLNSACGALKNMP